MRILIDTNILISAALNLQGNPYRAFVKAVTSPNHGIVCDQNIDELRRVFNRKFSSHIPALERFLATALPALEMIPTPTMDLPEEHAIRDAADRPILRAAIIAKVDILLTGDKDFLESGLRHPKIMTVAEFLHD